MIEPAEALLRQPLCKVAELTSADIPVEPGIYAWYRSGRLFYVGESHRGLRSRLWGNHLRGNARGSTLRNKVAKAFGFPPTGKRAYGRDAEQAISLKLLECELRFHPVLPTLIDETQAQLISELDPPMNDHPGEVPRWRIDDVREILAITTRRPTAPARKPTRKAACRTTRRKPTSHPPRHPRRADPVSPRSKDATFRKNVTTSRSCSGVFSSTRATTREPGLTGNAQPFYSSARRTSKSSSKADESSRSHSPTESFPTRLGSAASPNQLRRRRRREVDAELLGDVSTSSSPSERPRNAIKSSWRGWPNASL